MNAKKVLSDTNNWQNALRQMTMQLDLFYWVK